jgi:hypothetical protein
MPVKETLPSGAVAVSSKAPENQAAPFDMELSQLALGRRTGKP